MYYEDSHSSAYSCAHGYDLLQKRDLKQNLQTERHLWGTRASFQKPSSAGAHRMFNSSTNTLWQHMWMVWSTGKVIGNSMPKVFNGSCSHNCFLSGISQNSRLPEGRQVFSISLIAYSKGLATVTHSYLLGNGGSHPKSNFLTTSQGPCKHNFLWIAVSGCVNSFLHNRTFKWQAEKCFKSQVKRVIAL